MDEQISRIAVEHKLNLRALDLASEEAAKEIQEFKESLRKAIDPNTHSGIDVVLCGSFAQREITRESDCDYLVIVDELPDHRSVIEFISEIEHLREEKNLPAPGQQGIFGDFVTSAELLARIGLEADSNSGTTRRLLFLTESVSVYEPATRSSVIDKVLSRYCTDYDPLNRSNDDHIRVPRFLTNDLIRFWRTMAVDFGAKRWRSITPDWYLRFAKLVTTRKILFAGTLAAVFMTDHVLMERGADGDQHSRLVAHLKEQFDKPPLARLLASYDHVDDASKSALADILRVYDLFIAILNSRDGRTLLRRSDEREERAKTLRAETDGIATTIQESLEQVFFKDGFFRPLTQQYGLF